MFNDITVFLYLILICSCLLIAFLKRKENKFPIYIYFLIVLIVESIAYYLKTSTLPYQIGSLFYAAFFIFYYTHFTQKFKNAIYSIGGISLAVILFYILKFDPNFPIGIGITVAIFYLLLSLLWFYDQIKRPRNLFIINNQCFWISAANLFWSIIFIFRISLMYWLAAKDMEFLIVLGMIFKISLLLTYVLLLIGVTKKQERIDE